MNAARHTQRCLAALTASMITVVDVHAAVTDIYNQPLATTSSVVAKPNIMFILDNSGSMRRDFMPDNLGDGDDGYTGKYGYWAAHCNGVAFDPTYTYSPPVKPDGTSYADVSFANAISDGYAYIGYNSTLRESDTSRAVAVGTGVTFTLNSGGATSYAVGNSVAIAKRDDGATRMTGTVTAWNDVTRVLTVDITAAEGSGTYNNWYVSRMDALDGRYYYTYGSPGTQTAMGWSYNSSGVIANTFYNECMSNIGSSPGSGKFTQVTLNSGSNATLKQNYANWYAFYRTRQFLMRAAAGRAFQGLNNSYRVGFTTISDTGVTHNTNKFLDVADYGTSHKADFYKSLYTADGSSYTPLRASLSKVGRYFANKATGQASDPMQYSCQRNYAILSTDGYWNTNSESGTYGPLGLTGSDVGQQDGTEARPMRDGASSVKTTTITTTSVQRQEVTKTNRVTSTYRRYRWQIGNSLGWCGGNNNRYTLAEREQHRPATQDSTVTEVRDATTTTVQTIVETDGVVTSNTTGAPTTTYATVSTSASTPAGSSAGTFGNVGTTTNGCASPTGLQIPNPDLVPGSTVYTTTPDATCVNTCDYTYTNPANDTGGTLISTSAPVTVSTSAPTNIGSPTTGSTSNVVNTTTGGASTTLADVAQYYYGTDLRTTALGNCTSGSSGNNVCANDTLLPMPPLDTATHQHMTTYTIGMGLSGTLAYDPSYLTQTSGTYVNLKNGTINWPNPMGSEGATRIDDLWHAAVNGRGRYFATQNANTLSNALSSALSDAQKALGSAAGAATNSLEPVVGDNNSGYIATYTTVEWTGDIKAYPLDANTGVINTTTATWSAKTQLEALAAGSRNIKYMRPVSKALQAFNYTNLDADGYGANFTSFCSKTPQPIQCGTLSPAQVTAANTGTNLVNFLRGDATYEAETNTTNPLYRERAAKMGDVINASPVYVKKSPLKYTDTGYTAHVSATAGRRAMLYAAANDGMLHAFDATTGVEQWAFVPSFVMPNMFRLADVDYRNNHRYFVDGSPVVADIYTGSAWKTILVGGLNAGGRGYYAIDITDPDNPLGLWEFTDANMGLTYGNPVVTKRADGTWVVAVSSGLNNADGVGRLYLINANTGALVTSLSTGTGTASDPSGLNKINGWVESGVDNTSKRFYGGDMLGNLWRFDFDDQVTPAGAEVTKLAQFQHSSTSPQPITTKPQLTEVTASGGTKVPVIVVGTGRYLGTSDVDDTTVQSIYAIKDPLTGTGWGDVRTRSDIVTQTVTVSGSTGTGTTAAMDWSTKIGWKMDLPQSKERVVTDFVLTFNVLSLASAIPGTNECSPSGGSSWIYEINVGTGTAANGSTVSSFLGAFLVVGMSPIMTADGTLRIIIVGSDASVTTRTPPPSASPTPGARRSSWRELIN